MSRQENAAVLSIQMGNEEAVRVDEELALAREQARQKWRSERRNSRDRVETGGHEEVKEERKDSDVGQAGVDAEVAEVVNEFDRIPSSAESSGPPCSICLQEWDRHKKGVKMPCCWGKGSTWYCRPCVDLLFQLSPLGLVKCPNCSANVVMSEGGQLKSPKVVEIKKECRYCKRADQIIISWGLCADCTLGSQHCFKYECDTCGNLQRIAFPLWRWQVEGPESFTTRTWECKGRCNGRPRHWRVCKDHRLRVPMDDCPASWPQHGELLRSVRELREAQELERRAAQAERRRVLGGLDDFADTYHMMCGVCGLS